MSYNQDVIRYHNDAARMGFTYEQANAMRRDAQRLHTISEQECNGNLYRAEEGDSNGNGKPLTVGAMYQVGNINGPGPLRYYRTADRETPARARIEAAAASVGASVEFQGDPRGWPVRITKDGVTIAPPCRY
jgi:hypothetical protein